MKVSIALILLVVAMPSCVAIKAIRELAPSVKITFSRDVDVEQRKAVRQLIDQK